MAPRIPWTDEQDTLLRKLWVDPTVTIPELSKLVSHPLSSCKTRAMKFGLGFKASDRPQHNSNGFWSDEKLAELRHLIEVEGRPHTEVAERLGTTREAVGAMAKRKQIRAQRKAGQNVRRPKLRVIVNTAPPPPVVVPKADRFKPLDATSPRPWTSRAWGECAFPVEVDAAEQHACCAPTLGATYCTAHRAIMYRAPYEWERNAARRDGRVA